MKELILENQNLIYALANYFKGYSDKEDLFQAGCVGMILAYKNYDESRGVKFTTYATPYILGEMKKYIRENKGFKVSQSTNRLYLKIEKARLLLTQQLMHEPTAKELSHYLEMPESLIAEAISSGQVIASFDEPINDSGKELTLNDMIGSYDNLDELLDLKEALSTLEESEQKVIMLRYLQDNTQEQTAKNLGLSQVQVYRKEQKILTKLKDKLTA